MPSSCLRSRNQASFTQGQWIYINYLEFFCLGDLFSPHLFIHLIIYINMDSWIFIFTFWVKFQFFLFFFLFLFCFFSFLKIFQLWPLRVFSIDSCVSLIWPINSWVFFNTLFSDATRYSRLILYILFLQKYLLLKKSRPGYKLCSLLLVPWIAEQGNRCPSDNRERKYICTF